MTRKHLLTEGILTLALTVGLLTVLTVDSDVRALLTVHTSVWWFKAGFVAICLWGGWHGATCLNRAAWLWGLGRTREAIRG